MVNQNSAGLPEQLLAVTMAGRVLVPINFWLNPLEIVYIVENSGASVLLMDSQLDPAVSTGQPDQQPHRL